MNNSIFAELKRRNVFKVASVYLITAWLVLQIISVLVPYLKLPELFGSIVTVVLIIGFPFACIIAWAFELTPDGVKLSTEVEHHESITHETGSKINIALVVSLLLALAYISYDKLSTYQLDESKALSIAVLPFADMSPDSSQEYFSDGIAEEILNSLARLKQLQVIARTSSFQFKDKQQDIRSIAETLGANYVLEGSVRKDNNQLRVTAQLIEAESGTHLWSQTYDRQLSDIFSLQDELTYAITQALKLNLLPEQVKVEQGMTANQQAYDLFLKGRDLGYQRNASALNQARDYLEQAIELDPDFALAKAQLYVVYNLAAEHGDMDYQHSLSEAKELYLELLASEHEFPLKLTVFANYIMQTENKPQLVRKLYQRSAKLAPSDPIIQNWRFLGMMQTDGIEAVIEGREAFFKVNPLDQINIINLHIYHYWLGNQTQYQFYVDKLRDDSPEHSATASAVVNNLFIFKQQPRQALDYLASFKGEMNTGTKQLYIELLLITGKIDKAISTLRTYLGENGQHHEIYATSIVNLLSYLHNDPQPKFALLNLQKLLNLSEHDFDYYLLALQALSGDEEPFVAYMDQQFSDAEAFIAAKKEVPFMLFYAIIKFNREDRQYLKRYSWVSDKNNIERCLKTKGRTTGLCSLVLTYNGETDVDVLLGQAKNSTVIIDSGFPGVARYLLTAPHLVMLHDNPEFKAMANEYLDNTYRKWEKEFGVNANSSLTSSGSEIIH
ncbi:hypothetical protein [Aliiglaciecola litoralis]|uniref:FlgO domain-containing protein n=1 Tax=Aliiglaciecola litoralis TaxID=582857 RepID=A0ABP3WSB1_9ALTE